MPPERDSLRNTDQTYARLPATYLARQPRVLHPFLESFCQKTFHYAVGKRCLRGDGGQWYNAPVTDGKSKFKYPFAWQKARVTRHACSSMTQVLKYLRVWVGVAVTRVHRPGLRQREQSGWEADRQNYRQLVCRTCVRGGAALPTCVVHLVLGTGA